MNFLAYFVKSKIWGCWNIQTLIIILINGLWWSIPVTKAKAAVMFHLFQVPIKTDEFYFPKNKNLLRTPPRWRYLKQ